MYEVVVGNIGKIGTYTSKAQALRVFKEYKLFSKSTFGRVSGENVTIFGPDGEIIKEYVGEIRRKENESF